MPIKYSPGSGWQPNIEDTAPQTTEPNNPTRGFTRADALTVLYVVGVLALVWGGLWLMGGW